MIREDSCLLNPVIIRRKTRPICIARDHLKIYLPIDFFIGGSAIIESAVCCVPTVLPIPTPTRPPALIPTPVVTPFTLEKPPA